MSEDCFELSLSTIVFTDGASSGNPGPGGWAAVIRTPVGEIRELGGRDENTTNNRMELMGVVRALAHLSRQEGPVAIFTDSTYVIRGITQWIWGWRKRGWKTSGGKEVLNQDLWQRLFSLTYARKPKVVWRYVPGHAGVPGNERCDKIAVAYSKGRRPSLYSGPEAGYSDDFTILPPEVPVPEMKTRTKKAKAYSYLSYVNGEVQRHWDWSSCEASVRGRSGALFKKAASAEAEFDILKGWGVSASKLPGGQG